jgi:hypothetical protein
MNQFNDPFFNRIIHLPLNTYLGGSECRNIPYHDAVRWRYFIHGTGDIQMESNYSRNPGSGFCDFDQR